MVRAGRRERAATEGGRKGRVRMGQGREGGREGGRAATGGGGKEG